MKSKTFFTRIIFSFLFVCAPFFMQAQYGNESWVRFDSVPDPGGEGVLSKGVSDDHGGAYEIVTVNGDMFVVHYDDSLNVIWQTGFDANSLQYDFLSDIVMGTNDLIYVTGSAFSHATDNDVFLACLDTTGNVLWESSWSGAANLRDHAYAMALLPNGNIAVAGRTEIVMNKFDNLLEVWSSTGTLISYQQITSNYTWNFFNIFYDVLVTPQGNIVVCGTNLDPVSDYDGLISCYDISGSMLLWSRRYNFANGYNDGFNRMAMDDSSIYVCGSARSSSKILLQRYSFGGTLQWTVDTISGKIATDLTIDHAGNICVAVNNLNMGVVKVTPSASLLWQYNFIPPAPNGTDGTYSIAVDTADAIYVSGYTEVTSLSTDQTVFKLTPAGVLDWVNIRGGTGYNDDRLNHVFTDGATVYSSGTLWTNTGGKPFIAKYDLDGNLQDSTFFIHGEGGMSHLTYMTTDSTGNTFITSTGGTGIYLSKSDPDGNLLWKKIFLDSITCSPNALVTDIYGNIYITGTTNRPSTGYDVLTLKYDPLGNLQWMSVFASPGNGADRGETICVDTLGNVYVGATAADSANFQNISTIRYNSNGGLAWAQPYHGTFAGVVDVGRMTMDGPNVIYVPMTIWNTGTGYDMEFVKFDSSGTILWNYSWSGPSSDHGLFASVFGDHSVAFIGSSSAMMAFRLDASGAVIWSGPIPTTSTHTVTSINDAFAWNDKLYLCGGGFLASAPTITRFYTCVMDSSGVIAWDTLIFPRSLANSIDLDHASGVIGVTGYAFNYPEDIGSVFFDPSGAILDTAYFGDHGIDKGRTIKSVEGGFVVNGTVFYSPLSLYDRSISVTIKYCQGPVIQSSADTIICPGDTVQLNSTPGFISYQWNPSNSLTNDSIPNPVAWPIASTDYTVTAVNIYGCASSASHHVSVRPIPQISFSPSPASLCNGDTLQVQVLGVTNCLWQPGTDLASTTALINNAWPSATQTYQITGSDPWGCSSVDWLTISVMIPPNVFFSTSLPDSFCYNSPAILLTNGMPAGGIYSGSGISGSQFTPLNAGLGSVAVFYTYTDSATGCYAIAVDSVFVDTCNFLGVEDHDIAGSWNYFPNPASDLITIVPPEDASSPVLIQLFDATGRVIAEQHFLHTNSVYALSLNGIDSGIYYLLISPDGQRIMRKVIIQK
jgi:hypothetical protein